MHRKMMQLKANVRMSWHYCFAMIEKNRTRTQIVCIFLWVEGWIHQVEFMRISIASSQRSTSKLDSVQWTRYDIDTRHDFWPPRVNLYPISFHSYQMRSKMKSEHERDSRYTTHTEAFVGQKDSRRYTWASTLHSRSCTSLMPHAAWFTSTSLNMVRWVSVRTLRHSLTVTFMYIVFVSFRPSWFRIRPLTRLSRHECDSWYFLCVGHAKNATYAISIYTISART